MKSNLLKVALLVAVAAVSGAFLGYQLAKPKSDSPPIRSAEASENESDSSVSAKNRHATPARSDTASASDAIGSFADPSYQNLSFRDRVKLALSYDSHRKQNYAVELLFENLNPEDAPEMLAVLLEEPDRNKRRGMLRPFFVQWGKLDGEKALQVAESLAGREKLDALSAAYAGWGQSEPYKAWEATAPYLDGSSFRQAYIVHGAFQELAKHDLQAAIDAIPADTNRMFLQNLNQGLVQAAFETEQTDALLNHVLSLGDAEQSKQLLSRIFHQWGEKDTDAPINALSQLTDPKLAKEAMSGFIQGWMQSDREGALAYVVDNQNEPLVGDAAGNVIRQAFLEGTASENEALIQRLEQAGLVEQVAPDVVRGLSFTNPKLAMAFAERISDKDQQASYLSQALSGWAHNNIDSAVAYHQAIEDPDRRAELAPALVFSMGNQDDGAERVTALFQDMPAGEGRKAAVEKALGYASSPYAKENPDFVLAIAAIAAAEPGLSEGSKEQLKKLLPPEN